MKVSIIGGSGVVGSGAAYRIAQDGQVNEIVLIDTRRSLAEAHALDIEQAVVHRSTTRVRAGDAKDTRNSDVIFITASVPKKEIEISRREYLRENLPLVLDVVQTVLEYSPSALLIVATSPVDPLVYLIHRAFSLPRENVIGLNRNDTSRFRRAISRTLSVPSTSVEAFVLGEHGDSQVPVFSSIRIDGKPVSLRAGQVKRVREEMDSFFITWNRLQSGRTAGWTSAESVGDMVSSGAAEDGRIVTCSVSLQGEYGLKDVSLGVPVKLGRNKVKEIVEITLEGPELKALKASAASVAEMIREGQALIERGY